MTTKAPRAVVIPWTFGFDEHVTVSESLVVFWGGQPAVPEGVVTGHRIP
jgi:hypothetical protein